MCNGRLIQSPASKILTTNGAAMLLPSARIFLPLVISLCQIFAAGGQTASAVCCRNTCAAAGTQEACIVISPASVCQPQDCSCVWTNSTQVTSAGSQQLASCNSVGEIDLEEDEGGGGLGFGWVLLIAIAGSFVFLLCCCGGGFWYVKKRNRDAQAAGPWRSYGSRPGSFRERNKHASGSPMIAHPALPQEQLEALRMPAAMSPDEAQSITGYTSHGGLSRQDSRNGSFRGDPDRVNWNGSQRSGDFSPALSRQSSFRSTQSKNNTMRGSSRRRMAGVDGSPAAMERSESGEINISVTASPRSQTQLRHEQLLQGLVGGTPSVQSQSSFGNKSQGSYRSRHTERSHGSFRTRSVRSGEGGSMRSGERGHSGGMPWGDIKERPRSVHSHSTQSSRYSRNTHASNTRHYDDSPSTAFDSKKVGEEQFAEPLFKSAAATIDSALKKPEPTTYSFIPKDSDKVQRVHDGTSPRHRGRAHLAGGGSSRKMLSPPSPREREQGGEPAGAEKRKRQGKKERGVTIESRKPASLLFHALESDSHASPLFGMHRHQTGPIKEEEAGLRPPGSGGGRGNGANGASKGLARPRPPSLAVGGARATLGVIEGTLGFPPLPPQPLGDVDGQSTAGWSQTEEDALTEYSGRRQSGADEMEYDLGGMGGVDEETIFTPSQMRARARCYSEYVSVAGSGDTTPRSISRQVSHEFPARGSQAGGSRRASMEREGVMREVSGSSEDPTVDDLVRQFTANAAVPALSPSNRGGRGKRRGTSPEPQHPKHAPLTGTTMSVKPPSPEVHPYHRVSTVEEECTLDSLQVVAREEAILESNEEEEEDAAPSTAGLFGERMRGEEDAVHPADLAAGKDSAGAKGGEIWAVRLSRDSDFGELGVV